MTESYDGVTASRDVYEYSVTLIRLCLPSPRMLVLAILLQRVAMR